MKKIIKSICFSLLAFMFAIGSIFLPVGSKNSYQYASANNTTIGNAQFNSSNVVFSRLGFTTYGTSVTDFNQLLISNNSDQISYNKEFILYSWNFRIEFGSFNNDSVVPYFRLYAQARNSNSAIFPINGSTAFQFVKVAETVSWSALGTTNSYLTNVYVGDQNVRIRQSAIGVQIYQPSRVAPSLEIVSIELGSYDEFVSLVKPVGFEYDSRFTNSNVVCYTDSVGYKFYFFIPNWSPYEYVNYSDSYYYDYRKYYTSYSDTFNNNEFYNQGLNDGYANGFSEGQHLGYSQGSSVGYENGFENGKIEGALTANNYSFFGLISAVIDAPVKILTSLFNFEFLGVNLWAFFTSILTISLIIFVIRKFMAKG